MALFINQYTEYRLFHTPVNFNVCLPDFDLGKPSFRKPR